MNRIVRATAVVLLFFLASCRSSSPAHEALEQAKMGSRAAQFKLYAEAYFRFQKAAALAPSNPKYLNNLAVLAESRGQFEEAVRLYEKALSLAPGNRRIKENYEKLQAYLKPRAPKPPA